MSRRLLFAAAAVFLSTAVLAADKAKSPTLAEKTASKSHAVAAAPAPDGGTPAKAASAHDGGTGKAAPKK